MVITLRARARGYVIGRGVYYILSRVDNKEKRVSNGEVVSGK